MDAKAVGGPEQLVKVLFDAGKVAGRNSMLPVVTISFFGGVAVMALIGTVRSSLKERNAISEIVAEKAKRELIKGIQEYENSQPETRDENQFDQHANEVPEGCRTCEGPLPNCMPSCRMFDED